jgi:hypothetical protein
MAVIWSSCRTNVTGRPQLSPVNGLTSALRLVWIFKPADQIDSDHFLAAANAREIQT